ncbi:MAG: Lsm family RNA-binding protein [Nitrososphaeria archaeon]
MAAAAARRFGEEFALMLDRLIRVSTSSGQSFEGKLTAYSPSDYGLWLLEAQDKEGILHPKIFISGGIVSTIELLEKGLDLEKLADRINRLFPNMVKYVKQANTVVVMDRIRVTADGVVDGTGPAAEKVQKIYEEFVSDEAKKTEGR